MPRVTDLLDASCVVFPRGDKEHVIAALCRAATTDAWQRQSLEGAVLEREELAATALDCGVAVPHGHIPELDDFVMAVAILDKELDWDGEGHGVRVVFLIGAPEGHQTGYLRLLATIVKLVNQGDCPRQLADCRDPRQVVRWIRDHPLSPPQGAGRRATDRCN